MSDTGPGNARPISGCCAKKGQAHPRTRLWNVSLHDERAPAPQLPWRRPVHGELAPGPHRTPGWRAWVKGARAHLQAPPSHGSFGLWKPRPLPGFCPAPEGTSTRPLSGAQRRGAQGPQHPELQVEDPATKEPHWDEVRCRGRCLMSTSLTQRPLRGPADATPGPRPRAPPAW